MATFSNQIYQYKSPSAVDVSVLGQAVQFKQQNYEANTTNVQNLVNQYINMDLARDVDSEYLGQRLQSLVNYVNSSGQKDWSRTAVEKDVSSYIGKALDSNVAKAIASTKIYRKQRAEIDALKTSKPELYNSANEWHATQDWSRYMNSGQVGDSYRAQNYTNYVDVNKKVMEMAPKLLKEFGVQVVFQDGAGSTPMFRRVEKHEIITGEEARKFTNMVLGDDGKMQLGINSQYKNQAVPPSEVVKRYGDFIDSKVNSLTNQKQAFTASLGGATTKDKEIIKGNISKINEMITDLRTAGSTQKNRENMLFDMELENFSSGWGDLLSYDKTVSVDIDDSGYKIAKYNFDVNQAQFENELSVQKFNQGTFEFNQTYDLNLAKAIGEGKVIIDPLTGKPIAKPSSLDGVTITQNPTDTADKPIYTINNIEKEYNDSYKVAFEAVSNDIKDPVKRALLEKEFGSLEGADITQIVSNFVSKNGVDKAQAKLANAARKGLFSDETVQALMTAQEKYSPLNKMQGVLTELDTQVSDLTSKTIRHMKGETMYGMSSYYVDSEGKFKTGDEYLKSSKQYNDYNKYERVGAKLNTILMMEREGGMSESEIANLRALKRRYLAQLPKEEREVINETLKYEGESITSFNNLKRAGKGLAYLFNTVTGDVGAAKENMKDLKALNEKGYRINRDNFAFYQDTLNRGYDYDDSRTQRKMGLKVDNKQTSVSNFIESNIRPTIKRMDETAQTFNNEKLSNRSINIDSNIKGNEYVMSVVKAAMPDSQIIKGTNVSFNINEGGQSTVSAMVKEGTGTVLRTENIDLSMVPQKLLNKVIQENTQKQYDAAGSGMGYSWTTEILPTKKKVLEEYGDVSANPSAEGIKSREEILDIVEKTYGKQFINENKKVVDEILNQNIQMDAKLVGGAYVMDISSGNFSERQALNTTNLGTHINLITQQKEKISSEFILKNLNTVLNKNKK